MTDKYNVDWDTVIGEGAYGSVHPARLALTGEKVGRRVVTLLPSTNRPRLFFGHL